MQKMLSVSISAIAGMVLSFVALADADFESATFYNKMKVTSKAYVNTGYAPKGGTIVRAKYSPSGTGNACLYCARLSTSRNKDNPDFTFFVAVSSKLRFDYYTATYPGEQNISVNGVYELEVKGGKAIVSDANGVFDKAETSAETFDSPFTMYLFSSYSWNNGNPNGWDNGFQGEFYFLRIFEVEDGEEVLKHEFVPCKVGDKVGVADRVTETVKYDLGGNHFTIPADAEVVTFGPEVKERSVVRKDDGSYEVSFTMKTACESYAVRMVPVSGEPIEVTGGAIDAEVGKTIVFSDLAADTCYSPEIEVSNSAGVTEVELAAVSTGDISVAGGRDADLSAMSPAVFVISRGSSDAAKGYDLIVNYTVDGTDGSYEIPSGVATIPAGESSVEVKVMPVFDETLTTPLDLTLTLSSGNYGIGEDDSATVQILPAKIEAGLRYVGEKGDDSNSGLTPGVPMATIAAAVADLGDTGGTICVMPGTVSQSATAVISAPVKVVGLGLTPDETIVSASKSGFRLFELDNADAQVINLTMANASVSFGSGDNGGAGAFVKAGVISNCVVSSCSARQSSSARPYGGGVRMTGSNSLLTHSRIVECTTFIDANWADATGAGVHLDGGARIEHSLVLSCRINSTNPDYEKIVGGIHVGKNAKAVNCTVIGCTGSLCGGINATSDAGGVINCVMYNCQKILKNAVGDVETSLSPWKGTAAKFDHCATDEDTEITTGCYAGLTQAAFSNYKGGDYSPAYGEILFDNGAALESCPAVDLAGNSRVQGNAIDIGCYEGSAAVLAVAGTPENYGNCSIGWGSKSGLAGEQTVTVDATVITEDGLTRATCAAWNLYEADADGVFQKIGGGTGNSATFTVPNGAGKLEWVFTREFKMEMLDSVGRGNVTCDEWVAENEVFAPVVSPDENWYLSGWLVNDVTVDGSVTSFTADGPKTFQPVFLPVGATRPVLYVAEDGSDENDGFDPDCPCATIKAALTTALKYTTLRGCIWISSGTYGTNKLEIKTPLEIRGTTGRPEDVIINSDKQNTQVFLLKNEQILVSGVTVSGADMWVGEGETYADSGGGFCVLNGTVSNCVVRNCSARQTSTPIPMGGGVYLGGTGAFMTHCIVSNCTSTADSDWCGLCGGGVHVVNGAIENSLVENCRIAKAEPNCDKIIGGLYVAGGRAVNCTVVNCTGSQCGGIRVESKAVATNCVVFGCKKTIMVGEEGSKTLETTVSPYTGAAAGFVNCATDGEAAINETCKLIDATAFKDYAHGNFTPVIGGALYDAGVTPEGWDKLVDLAGKRRVFHEIIDIGCYEAALPSGIVLIFR